MQHQSLPAFLLRYRLPWVVLAASLSLSLALTAVTYRQQRHAAEQLVINQTRNIAQTIEQRFRAYDAILTGARGLFYSSEDVTRAEWKQYITDIHIQNLLPGIQALGFARVIAHDDIAALENEIRQEGFTSFTFHPKGERDMYTSIVYIEPFDWRNQRAFGYDMFSEPVRREAMSLARDSGDSTLSGKVTLMQETEQDMQAGFLMYLPLYRSRNVPTTLAERREQLFGYVYSPFRVKDFMNALLTEHPLIIGITIHEKHNGDLLYQSGQHTEDTQDTGDRKTYTDIMNYGGRQWLLTSAASEQAIHRQTLPLSLGVLLTGLIDSALLFVATLFLLHWRTKSLSLRQQASALQNTNEELQRFVYAASHDLKSPLRAINNLAQWIQHDSNNALSEKSTRHITQLQQRIIRMERLLNGLLDYSRAGTQPSQQSATNMKELLDDCLQLLHIPPRFSVHVTCPAITVITARPALQLVLFNLLSNAIKHNDNPYPAIRLSVAAADGGLQLRVCDNGSGIAAEYHETVFGLFQTLAPDKQENTGLGLALVKRVVKAQQGSIVINSEPAGDCCFTVTWPCIIANPPASS